MSYLPKYQITDKIRTTLRDIDRLKDKIRGTHLRPEARASVYLRASVETIHSSTSIEGNPLTASQVRALVASDQILTREEYAEIEVRNYKHALDYIEKRRHSNADFSVEDILTLHRIITHRLLDDSRNGHFRHNPVYIENPQHEVLYTAVEAALVAHELEELIAWVHENQYLLHPALIAAVIHFRIAAIHPFADGNGRTARAATSLYLALSGYDCDGSLALDTYYATDRHAYYAVLQLVNGPDYASSLGADLTPWLEYYVEGFLTSLHVLDAEMRIVNLLSSGVDAHELDRDDQDLMSYAATFGAISIAEAMDVLPEKGRRSVQRRLKNLVELGYLEQAGEGKGAKYRMKAF